jgi:hypothetical protein
LSFFDEPDEPRTAVRTPPPRRRPAGGGRRPPTDRQAILVRRAVAAGGLLVLIIVIAVGVSSCESSARVNALKDYNDNVASLIQRSNQTGSRFFGVLGGASGATNAAGVTSQIDQTRLAADSQLSRARGLSVPDAVKGAQQDVVLALQMRRDGIADVARHLQPALANTASQDAVNQIAADMASLYASDVVYKSYALPQIANALSSAGVTGEQMNGGQFVPDIRWVTPSFVATQLHVAAAAPANKKAAPGVHGHAMQSCSAGGTALSTSATNTLSASPPPTFTCLFTNDGQNQETNVVVKVTVSGTSVSGQTVVPQTTPGQQASAQITLSSAPPAGSYTVSATVERVPGETTTTHNTLSFPVTFH